MARRLVYFPMLVNEIKRHFGSFFRSNNRDEPADFEFDDRDSSFSRRSLSASPISSRSASTISSAEGLSSVAINCPSFWWFTCKFEENDLMIPLHFPIGLIYDLINCLRGNPLQIPWKLEFNLSNKSPVLTNSYYSTILDSSIIYTPFPDESCMTSFYFATLKEADHLRSGSAKNVMNLTRSEQLQLWESLKGGEFDRFWRINQKLIGSNLPRSVPIKFWVITPELQVTRFQFPISSNQSLKSLLETEFNSFAVKTVLLHGVDLPLDVTIEELNYNWNYADNFLQIILKIQ